MKLRLAFAFLLAASTAFAQRQMTVAQLRTFIRSSIQMRNDDRQVADFLRNVTLKEQLDARTIEDLQGLGAGPRTVALLKTMMTQTAKLPPAAPPEAPTAAATIPAPNSIEQKKILAEITRRALDYSDSLPNFICTQVTRRHVDPTGTENWRTADTIQERLSYFDHKEEYRVDLVNNTPVTNVSHNQLGGATSSGEFGSILREIFQAESHTEFDWERWATLRARRMYVFAFRVPQRYSKYTIYHRESDRLITAGYHGLVYAERNSNQVMRVRFDADGIPPDFPIQRVSLDLNYDFTDIAGQEFVLPLKADLRSSQGRYLNWNEVEFHLYRRFGTDTSITFDPVGEIPDERIQEETPQDAPVKDSPPPQISPAREQ